MTVFFSPYANSQFVDNNGLPAVGYTITTYAAGSSSLLSTYTDSTGGSANLNPLTLDAGGRNPSGKFWLTSGLSYKFIVKDAGGVTVQTVDGITGTNDPTAITSLDQWVSYTGTPTYISGTSFSVAGDQTTALHVGRRLKSTNTVGTRYSTITVSSFAAGVTTLTVTNDSGTLDSGLSAVSYALLSAVSPSLPDSAAARASLGVSTGYASTTSATGGITLPTWLGGYGLRWGNVATSAVADVTATFATPFSTAFYAAIGIVVNGGGSGSTLASLGATSVSAISVGAYVSNTGARAVATVYYFAIGK